MGKLKLVKKTTEETPKKTIFVKKEQTVSDSSSKYHDLREVMDYTKQFSIFYSGVENDTYFNGCYDMGVRDFLMSYHYLQGSRTPLHVKYGDKGVKFFIDSGAFTYINDPKYRDYDIEHWEKHISQYLKWAEKNREYIFAIANCDFEAFVGGDKVLEWNEKYFEPFMLRTGIPVCFVWHENSARTWEQYCQRYPYTGFSSVNFEGDALDIQQLKERLFIAEKNDALVHGFGMTRTSMLPQLPYYTVDSTSWKSGFRYGQIAIWNGKKVQMFKKEDFDTKVFKYTRTYDLDPPINEAQIRDYYEPEVLRACVYAYMRAEEFIRERLKSLSYWFKRKAKNRTEIDDSLFPSAEWVSTALDGEAPNGWKDYAEKLNISTEAETGVSITSIVDMTCFMHWDSTEYQEYIQKTYTEDVLKDLHDTYVNRIVGSTDEMIEDLKKFYFNCYTGENTTLLYLGTNFDRMVKERDSYIDDEEYETVDMDDMEVYNSLSRLLPDLSDGKSSAPEIDELDDEIFEKAGIVPIRDAGGKFLKGQHKVLKPKLLYSQKFPKLACDTCYNAQKCPEYKAGYVCAYNKVFDKFNTRDMNDVIQAMQGIVDYSLVRVQRAMFTETLSGGMPDPAVSSLLDQSMRYLSNLKAMYESGGTEVLRQTNILHSDGTREQTTQITNPQSGGILAKIFGDMSEKSSKREVVADVNKDL